MYALAEYQDLRQTKAENGREAAADGYCETMPYVARELGWELARYLDALDS